MKLIKDKIGIGENWIPGNIDSVFTYGFSLKFSYRKDYLKMNTIFKFTDGSEFHNNLKNELQYIPKKTFSLNIFLLKEPEIYFSLRYNDKIKKLNFEDIPAYYIINAGIIKDIKNMRISLYLNNILNRKHYSNFGYISKEYYPGEPFTMKIKISLKI